jgi:xanthine dehydrogenase D subunit
VSTAGAGPVSGGGSAAGGSTITRSARGVGADVRRPDAVPKVQGAFAFSNDLYERGMLHGHTLRSTLPAARVRRLDIGPALAMPGVHAVLTAADVPGSPTYGLEHKDQPVFASDVVRYQGEPLAVVAADHPETARRAVEAIVVELDELVPLTDPEAAIGAPPIHPDGNVIRRVTVRHGDADVAGEVVVEGTYEVGMQDQAFLGTESALARPSEDGGVELWIATQWLHVDRDQVADCLGLPRDKVVLHLAGVGGAFGAREDVSLHVHICLLALRTGRPVKMQYSRLESFFGHVHRHPARMWYRHQADRDGRLVKVEARVVLDGGAYASSSSAVVANAVSFSCGPYKVPNAFVDGVVVRTNNPPCGAMRGFGAVQTCFAHESQMDKLAAVLGMDPMELRLLNALEPGDHLITGQRIHGTAPVRAVIEGAAAHPLPSVPGPDTDDPMLLPGGSGRTAERGQIRRGVGFACGFKNLMFSEGFDDFSIASCRVRADGTVSVKCACAEVGQGFVTLVAQIAATVLGVDDVELEPVDTLIGSAGSTSASRQTWMSGGAVKAACEAVRDRAVALVAERHSLAPDGLEVRDGAVVSLDGQLVVPLATVAGWTELREEVVYRHPPTARLDENGQGDAHVSWAFAAHRAVVDVDPELGLVRVVQITTGQDVGVALNPLQVIGQIEGGIAQGVGLAVMEEVVVKEGRISNPSFTDYLIPTALDMPEVEASLIEEPEPGAPFGAKGVGEPPTLSSTPAVVAAIRAATGVDLTRVPVRPQDIALANRPS